MKFFQSLHVIKSDGKTKYCNCSSGSLLWVAGKATAFKLASHTSAMWILLLYFWYWSLLRARGKQQTIAQVFGTSHPQGRAEWSSWLVSLIWVVHCGYLESKPADVRSLSVSPSLPFSVTLPLYIHIYVQVYNLQSIYVCVCVCVLQKASE